MVKYLFVAMDNDYDVLISGAGIGGLTLAYMLGRVGAKVLVLEQSPVLREVGAGIQLGPNATKILDDIQVIEDIYQFAYSPEYLCVKDALSGKNVIKAHLAEKMIKEYGAPYFSINRKDLHSVLYYQCVNSDNVNIYYGCKVVSYSETDDYVTIKTSSDKKVSGKLLVGADGVHSLIRNIISNECGAYYTKQIALRGFVPISNVSHLSNIDNVVLTLAPNGHLVHYPINSGKLLNIVLIVNENYNSAYSADNMEQELSYTKDISVITKNWDNNTKDVLNYCSNWLVWPLFARNSLDIWWNRRVVLLGDAAHPMLPYLAQGAAMAIEDAWVLANYYKLYDGDIDSILFAYSNKRVARANLVQRESFKNSARFHSDGLVRHVRNMALNIANKIDDEYFLRRYSWLYKGIENI